MQLTQEQIEKGFWRSDSELKLQTSSIYFPEDYSGGDILNIACTQLVAVRTYPEQKKLVKKWCDFLPTLKEVKYIRFTTQINQDLFDAVCKMSNLESFYIKWSSVKDISNIRSLKKLLHLHIGSSSQIKDLSPLGKMKGLVTLELEHIKTMQDISFISTLTNLQGLSLEGSVESIQRINTLKPITSLKKLKFISLTATKISDGSLQPLAELKNLESINIALWYPQEEFVYVHRNLPVLKYGNIVAIVADPDYQKNKMKALDKILKSK